MKKTLKKLMVFSMTGAMMLAPMSAMAADSTTTSPAGSSAQGTGNLEGYVNKDVFSVQLPTITDQSIFNFTLDPQKLLNSTGGQGGEPNKNKYDAGSTLFFKQADDNYKNTSQTLTAINTGTNKVNVTLSATASNLGNLKLSDTETMSGTDTSIYLALTQTGADDANSDAALKEDTGASLTGSLKGVNKDLFETKYNASLPGNYEFVLKDDEKAKIDTDDGTNFPRVTFGLKGAANATDGVDWSTVDTTSTQPTVDVKWTLTDGNITGPSVQTTATFTKGTALEIPVTLGNGDTAATKATVTYSSTENGTYKAYANLFSYAKGKITVSSSACRSVASGTVVYLKVAFNDTAKTTQVIQLTVQE